MKVDYFFPVFKDNNVEEFCNNFFKSGFFKKTEQNKIIFACVKDDKKNLDFLKKITENNKKIKVLIFDKEYSYNDAFNLSISYFDADIVLLGDVNLNKIDLVFEKCIEKFKGGANIVHVVKRRRGFKGFVLDVLKSCYNFFIKIFTNKKDRLNEVSLGLMDKNIVDLLKVLPKKRCFLKNTKDLIGFESRTIYIDDKTKTYKNKFKTKTQSLLISLIGGCVNIFSLVLAILLNCLFAVPVWANIILISCIVVTVILFSLFLPKHFFDIRNYPSKNIEFEIKEIN